eukprot:TRINITY_DN50611_c0_g1_i1.p1 TRINITY_DN50611_c0_g1~~TRINITY_DN50611_c0_g1_i1.p1  ORF type:complete len:703 (+),score=249.20 TRINITY_DN50611_c0_g1_i1:80-2110(+)
MPEERPLSAGEDEGLPKTGSASFRMARKQSTLAEAKRDQELQQLVREKLKRREQAAKLKEEELGAARKAVAQVKRDLGDVTVQLSSENRPQERLGLLERKEELLNESARAEAELEAATDRWAGEERELSWTADEERVLRGMRAELQARAQMTKQEENEKRPALQRRQSMRDAGSTKEVEEQARKTLESAKAKQARLAQLSQQRQDLESQHASEAGPLEAQIERLAALKQTQEGQEFLATSEELLEKHAQLQALEDRCSKRAEEIDRALAAEALTPEEEAALRGAQARQREHCAHRQRDSHSTPRKRHADYAQRGGETIREAEVKRRAEAQRGARDLCECNEALTRVRISLSEGQQRLKGIREASQALLSGAGGDGDAAARMAAAEQRLAFVEALSQIEQLASGQLKPLHDERQKLLVLQGEIDKRLDRSVVRAEKALKEKRSRQRLGEDSPYSSPGSRDGRPSPRPRYIPSRAGTTEPRGAARNAKLPLLSQTPEPVGPPLSDGPSPRRVFGASARLVRPPRRAQLPDLDRGPRLAKLRQEQVNQRLHDREMTVRREQAVRAEDAAEAKLRSTTRLIKPEQEQELVQRLFNQQVDRERQMVQRLGERWLSSPRARKLSTEAEKECNQRMFYGRRDHRGEVRAQLRKKYISDTDPVFPRYDRKRLQEAFTRLAGAAG